jgi:predicted nucleic acid-binding protein
MGANPVLVDSSYYIDCLRQGRDPFLLLAVMAATRDLAICGVVRCEVGRGLRLPRLRAKFAAFWDVMLNVPSDNRLWTETEQTLWELDRKGIVLPLTDVFIACSARRIGAVVLTRDKHFYDIPNVAVMTELPL